MSNAGKDESRGSSDSAQQKGSSSAASQLRSLGSARSETPARAASAASVAQPGEASRKQSAKAVDRGAPLLERKAPVKRPPPTLQDLAPATKRSNTPQTIRPCSAVARRPYKDRIVHLLALRSYKKPELLARLERDGIFKKDRGTFGVILNQVARLNIKENTYSLKDSLFKFVEKDWPGYSERERQSLELILSGKSNASPNGSSASSQPPETPPGDSPPSSEQQKTPQPSSRVQSSLSGHCLTSGEKTAATTTPVPLPLPPTLLPTSSLLPAVTSPSTPEGRGTQDLPENPLSQNSGGSCEDQQAAETGRAPLGTLTPAAVPAEPPKPAEKQPVLKTTKRKHGESTAADTTGANGEEKDLVGEEGARPRKRCCLGSGEGVKETCPAPEAVSSPREQPDYFLKYVAITSLEQRERYKDDFNAEYNEYRTLHAQIDSVTRRFTELRDQWHLLSPGSKESQELQEKILGEYQKIREWSPSYHRVKRRCEYLHGKLEHIKSLVEGFDQQRSSPAAGSTTE